MAGLLANFRNTIILSVILALVIVVAYSTGPQGTGPAFEQSLVALGAIAKGMGETITSSPWRRPRSTGPGRIDMPRPRASSNTRKPVARMIFSC